MQGVLLVSIVTQTKAFTKVELPHYNFVDIYY